MERRLTFHTIRLVLVDTYRIIRGARVALVASSLAYTTILSIIPVLAVSFAIFKAFGGMDRVYSTIEPFIFENLAEGADEQAIAWMRKFIGNTHAATVGIGGLVALLATCTSMFSSVEKAINQIWGVELNRGWFQRFSAYWLLITLGPMALSIALGVVTSADGALPISSYIPDGTGAFILTGVFLSAVYKWVPHRPVHAWAACISGFVAAGCFVAAKWGYSIYTARVVTYSKVYGSLGAVPILLLWIDIAWIVALSGAALTVALQRRIDDPVVLIKKKILQKEAK